MHKALNSQDREPEKKLFGDLLTCIMATAVISWKEAGVTNVSVLPYKKDVQQKP